MLFLVPLPYPTDQFIFLFNFGIQFKKYSSPFFLDFSPYNFHIEKQEPAP